jgi:mono/diheme cytochrome c family protein
MRNSRAMVVGICLAAATITVAAPAFSKKAASKQACPTGQAVFQQNCASCHAGGANSVNPQKPIAGSKKLASLVTFKAYLEHPQGHMPFYKHVIADKQVLQALYDYCKKLKPTAGA